MSLSSDLGTLLMRSTARLTVRHGAGLDFSADEVGRTRTIRVPTRHGTVRCSVVRPRGHETPGVGDPAYVHLHGGAFLMRYPQMDDFFVHHVAAQAGVAGLSVDYDVAPFHRYPVAQEQAHDVVAWLAGPESGHGAEVGIDGRRLAVGGFSAGGQLAASACLQLRDSGAAAPRLQLVAVPVLDVTTTRKRSDVNPSPMITDGLVAMVRGSYFTDPDRRGEPMASPLMATSLAGLPPAVVVTAELDALRAEGDRYAERLTADGVEVEHVVVAARDHYFMTGENERSRADARGLMDRLADSIGARVRP